MYVLLLIVDYREQTSRWWISCYGGSSGMIKRPLEPFYLCKVNCVSAVSFIDSMKWSKVKCQENYRFNEKKNSFDIPVMLTNECDNI